MAYWSEQSMLNLVLESALDLDIFALADSDGLDLDDTRPLKACITQWRKIPPDCTPVEAKACAHYLNGMLARADARRRGYDIGILFDTEGFVAECSIEALFVVCDSVLLTPPLGRILRSITRQTIIEVAHEEGIEVEEGPINRERLFSANEIFTSATSAKVQPVGQLESKMLVETPGPHSTRLIQLCKEIVQGGISRYKKWLTPIYQSGV
jgi:branched-chain amino acid aminotransferase